MALWRAIEKRRNGVISPAAAADRLRCGRLSRLELNVEVEIKSPHHGPITWLDVDSTEERYVLTGGADCTIALFDLDGPGEKEEEDTSSLPSSSAFVSSAGAATRRSAPRRRQDQTRRRRRAKKLREVGRTQRVPPSQRSSAYGGHHHSVSVVRWYPVDTGLFVSGAMDGVVKLWDTNALDVVLEFDFKEKVFAAAMSATPGQQQLVAVGTDSPQARLCDIRSGAFSHALTGHSEAVWACGWSPESEYLLATGSADQTARLWDIRRSGASACLISLDQHQEDEEDHGEEVDEGIRGGVPKGGASSRDDRGADGLSRKRGYLKHLKLAPHASRASKFARAHAGPVNSLCFTPDGLHLLTAGTDNRLRLWEVETGRNTMTNYLQTKNKRRRPFGMAVAQPAGRRSETVFFPNDKSGDVLIFPLHTMDGRPNGQLRAHFDPVQCCAYRPRTQEIVTCGADGLVLLWSAAPPPWVSRSSYLPSPVYGGGGGGTVSGASNGSRGVKRRMLGQGEEYAEDQDMWSSEDEVDARNRTAEGFDDWQAATEGEKAESNSRYVSEGNNTGGSSIGGAFVPPVLMQERRRGAGGGSVGSGSGRGR